MVASRGGDSPYSQFHVHSNRGPRILATEFPEWSLCVIPVFKSSRFDHMATDHRNDVIRGEDVILGIDFIILDAPSGGCDSS